MPKEQRSEDPIMELRKEFARMRRSSKHCKGKQDFVVGYDHTGYILWCCGCGYLYEWEDITRLGAMSIHTPWFPLNIKEWTEWIMKTNESTGFEFKPRDIDTMLLRLHEEVAEAAIKAKDILPEEMEDKKKLEPIGMELADLIIRVLHTCSVLGIDIENFMYGVMKKNEKRAKLHSHRRR